MFQKRCAINLLDSATWLFSRNLYVLWLYYSGPLDWVVASYACKYSLRFTLFCGCLNTCTRARTSTSMCVTLNGCSILATYRDALCAHHYITNSTIRRRRSKTVASYGLCSRILRATAFRGSTAGPRGACRVSLEGEGK